MQIAELFSVSSEWLITNAISLATGIVVLIGGWTLSRTLAHAVRRLLPRTHAFDETIAPMLSQVVRYGILVITIVIVLAQFGVQTTSILAILGAAGLAIALALQGTLANIAAGVMLIWLRPIAVGEYVDGEGLAGTVVEVGLFGIRLRTADGIYVFAPNSKLWAAAITNYSREPRRRLDTKVGISYDADIAKARKVLLEIARDDRVLADPAPAVYVAALGASSVDMLLRCWVKTADYWDVLYEFNERAKLGLDHAGVEIPFNKLDVNILTTPDNSAGEVSQPRRKPRVPHIEGSEPPASE